MSKGHIMNSNPPLDTSRRAMLAAGLASMLAAAGCGGGGGGGAAAPDAPPAQPPSGENPQPTDPFVETRAWQTARELNQGDIPNVNLGEPEIVLDGDRAGMAVWVRTEGTRVTLWASRYAVDGTWQPARQIDAALVGAPSEPRMAVDAAGNAIVVWLISHQGRINVATNRFAIFDGQWGAARLLQRDIEADAASPRVAMTADGNAVAVWSQPPAIGGRAQIFSNTYVVDVDWTDNIRAVAEAVGLEPSVNPQLALDAQGNATVVWQRMAASLAGRDLWSSTLAADADAWGPVMDLRPQIGVPGSSESPNLAVSADGTAMVIWQLVGNNGSTAIVSRRHAPGAAAWEPTAVVVEPGTLAPANPWLALAADGHALAVWDQIAADAQGRTIMASRFNPAPAAGVKPWGAAANLERVRGGISTAPRLAMDADGNALAVWNQLDGNRTSVLSARYQASASAWTPTGRRLQANETASGGGVRVALRPEGTAVAIWRERTKSADGVGLVDSIWSADFK